MYSNSYLFEFVIRCCIFDGGLQSRVSRYYGHKGIRAMGSIAGTSISSTAEGITPFLVLQRPQWAFAQGAFSWDRMLRVNK